MAQSEKPRRKAAAQIYVNANRLARWDKIARILGMTRVEFLRHSADVMCEKIESQGAADNQPR